MYSCSTSIDALTTFDHILLWVLLLILRNTTWVPWMCLSWLAVAVKV
jgi:hypothetical protein